MPKGLLFFLFAEVCAYESSAEIRGRILASPVLAVARAWVFRVLSMGRFGFDFSIKFVMDDSCCEGIEIFRKFVGFIFRSTLLY